MNAIGVAVCARNVLVFGIVLIGISHRAGAQRYDEIPSPRPDGWVVDLTNSVPEFAKNQLNELCKEIHNFKNAELAIVVIATTRDRQPRAYATDLFNHWGIGDSRENNGILLFVAMDDRKAELVLGDGVDDPVHEDAANRIMQQYIIPRFRKADIAGALYGGAFGSARDILRINDLQTKIPAGALDRVSNPPRRNAAGNRVRVNQQRRPGMPSFWIWMTGGLLGFGGIALIGSRYYVRYRSRRCPNCSHAMKLLDEAEDDAMLDKPERIEERLGSADYDVWACRNCNEALKIRYGVFFTRYSKCPQCGYKTKSKVQKTIIMATTSHGGRVRVDEDCANCSYHDSYTYNTPRIEKSSSTFTSSSGGFGSGGFGGFGGGSSSGFGGGSSSGGGASGSW